MARVSMARDHQLEQVSSHGQFHISPPEHHREDVDGNLSRAACPPSTPAPRPLITRPRTTATGAFSSQRPGWCRPARSRFACRTFGWAAFAADSGGGPSRESDVVGLIADLARRPLKGPGLLPPAERRWSMRWRDRVGRAATPPICMARGWLIGPWRRCAAVLCGTATPNCKMRDSRFEATLRPPVETVEAAKATLLLSHETPPRAAHASPGFQHRLYRTALAGSKSRMSACTIAGRRGGHHHDLH